uniref:Uncharacterized protein n=1 Tax=Pithovirus LCPAC102 TaxID=2506587 RepID=A0A481Z359_9VIRU|nr:MAG: uncharacterized protein LCPAC102_01160 [Pithovirus LCPAC102]
MRISIIGTAGRKDDGNKLNYDLFMKMYKKAKDHLHSIINSYDIKYSDIELISGGSSYSDHIAIFLYYEYYGYGIKLTLHLPANFINGQYRDNNNKHHPGNTLNFYHSKFSQKIGIKSLMQIEQAISMGANVHIHNGFYERNKHVADTDIMIAFTFGYDNLKSGGTKYTWDNSSCKDKTHYPIHHL